MLNATQNCLFDSVDIENNGVGNSVATSAGVRINHGAGNNVFLRCEIDQNAPVHLLIIQDDVADPIIAGGFAQPEANVFLGCVVERATSSSSTLVLIRDGRRNKFISCDFSNTSLPFTVQFANSPTLANSQNGFVDSTFVGFSGATLAVLEGNAFRNYFEGCFGETHKAVLQSANRVQTDGMNFWSNSGASYTNTAGSAVNNNQGPQFTGNVDFGGNLLSGWSTGRAAYPATGFSTETSLGWYRSAASIMGLSYGTLMASALSGDLLASGATITSNASIGGVLGVSGAITALGAGGSVRLGAADASQANFFLSGGDTYLDYLGIWRLRAVGSGYAQVMQVFTGGTPNNQIIWGFPMSGNAGTAVNPGYAYSSETSLGWYRSGVSTMALSYGTFNLATQGVRLSMRTIAASALTASAANTNVAVNETVFTIQASGASFAINSGGTTWIFNSDASAKNT